MVQLKNKRSKRRTKSSRAPGGGNKEAVSKYAGDAYDLARRTWSGLNEIRRLINIEEKYLDFNLTQSPDTAGTVSCITQVAQGVTMNTRVGNSIRVQRLSVLGRATVSTAVTTFSLVRVIVFRDMEGQGTAPTMGDVLELVSNTAAPRSPIDWLNRKRFSILYSELIPLTVVTGGNGIAVFKYEVALGKHTLYRGTTAAAASDGEGSIYVGCISDEATNVPSVNSYTRIEYTDD